jgi:hypothetical protein
MLATGHERHGWRVHVETPHGLQAFGVLVAPCHDAWRARILTFPNILWTIPGGGGSIKFAGSTAEEAERRAIAFIEEHCLERNFLRRDQLDPVEVRAISEEPLPRDEQRRHQASKRKTCFLPVRFGNERTRRKGTTVNLSREGMFIGTPAPLEAGESIRLHLSAGDQMVPLRGIVIWNRRRQEAGRPLGMGVRLVDPAPAYPRFVDGLA